MSGVAMDSLPGAALPSLDPGAARRFTIDGDEALEASVGLACAQVVSGIRGLIPHSRLEAILLGGGYGRGEGGVLRGADGDRPYNDLEFYVAIRGNRHLNAARYRRRLEVLAEILTHVAGIEVEFKTTSLSEMASKPVSMFSYDLACGHRLLWTGRGADDGPWLRHLDARAIPLAEATRLLMNRGTGLLLARSKLEAPEFPASASDFVQRNIAKAQLACGDALLVAHGEYHWSCRVRHRRLAALSNSLGFPPLESVLRHHAAGVEFKLRPSMAVAPREPLAALHREVTDLARGCWLATESLRLGPTFNSVREYARARGDKCPGTPAPLNALLNLRADGAQGRRPGALWRHPRGRIYTSLALLLWEPDSGTDPFKRVSLESELGRCTVADGGFAGAYRSLWERVR
jgi:hypothetical protein